jgi:lysozyme family protein
MADFAPAFSFLMDHEDRTRSGKVTEDAGGRTRFGIAEAYHKFDVPEDFYTCPKEQAIIVAEQIAHAQYWCRVHGDEIESQPIATKLLDMAFDMGVKEAGVLAQRAINGLLRGSSSCVNVDGVIGDRTVLAINRCLPADMVETLCNLSKIFYYQAVAHNPLQQDRNLDGWLKRAEAVPPGGERAARPPLAQGAGA